MMWSPRHTLAAGMGLIAVVNAIALGGAAYNRSGTAESSLQLSEREFDKPYRRSSTENSGTSLRLHWRVLPAERPQGANDLGFEGASYYNYFSPAWLDNAKMASLGFSITPTRRDADKFQRFGRDLPRDVLLVLELDGPAYQEALARAKHHAEVKPQSGDSALVREQNETSRLFVVDAGLDGAALRARFPDRQHYAIVHGQVRPGWRDYQGNASTPGYIHRVSNDTVNVPLAWKDAVGSAHYQLEVSFGQRLEPWIVGARASVP